MNGDTVFTDFSHAAEITCVSDHPEFKIKLFKHHFVQYFSFR